MGDAHSPVTAPAAPVIFAPVPGATPDMQEQHMNIASIAPLKTADAAILAGVSPKTLENLRYLGGGPKYLKLGRRVVYDPRDIEAWKDQHRVGSTSEAA